MGRLLYYLPSGHRTESHIPHLSLPVSLCVVSGSHKRSLLFSAIPSRLLSPFFHPSGVSCLLFFFLFLNFPPLCHCCSVSFTPFPLLCAESICVLSFLPSLLLSSPGLCLLLSHPPPPPWIHAFHVGTFLSIPQSSELRCAYLAV